ncbi:MAG: hypothetical protein CMI63_20535 [Parvularcula sp.]|uniref:hypothetical protein n=1 Tax=Hyphococcus sp. TaxID=2038636 RepID=UPI000C64E0A6|nr:hypothetical protein [Parvularcula sp.]
MTETELDAILSDPLAEARAAGGAIGYVGFDIPQDILLSPGLNAFHLPWRPEGGGAAAEKWTESSFPPLAKSILQQWADGVFDNIFEYVIFTRGNDVSQRLYYYVCELQRTGVVKGPQPLIFDAAKIRRASSLAHTEDAVRRLCAGLGVSEEALAAGAKRANECRNAVAALNTNRQGAGAYYEKLARALLFAAPEPLFGPAPELAPPPKGRLLLAGSTPPDGRLHAAAARAGYEVAGEYYDGALLRYGAPVNLEEGSVERAIAQATQDALSPRLFADEAASIAKAARAANADAAIIWLIEEDEALVWRLPRQLDALKQAGIPALSLTRRRWDAGDGAAADIAAFLGSLS